MGKIVEICRFLQKYVKKHIKIFAHIKKKQYLCNGFEK
jgi:hypothetical protein